MFEKKIETEWKKVGEDDNTKSYTTLDVWIKIASMHQSLLSKLNGLGPLILAGS
jgi:hypothetical protein